MVMALGVAVLGIYNTIIEQLVAAGLLDEGEDEEEEEEEEEESGEIDKSFIM